MVFLLAFGVGLGIGIGGCVPAADGTSQAERYPKGEAGIRVGAGQQFR